MRESQISLAISSAYPWKLSPKDVCLGQFPEKIHMIFSPIEKLLCQILDTGEMDTVQGSPVMSIDWEGSWATAEAAILGVCDAVEIVAEEAGTPIDLRPLRKLARYLKNGVMLSEEDVSAASNCLSTAKDVLASSSLESAQRAVLVVQIKNELLRG